MLIIPVGLDLIFRIQKNFYLETRHWRPTGAYDIGSWQANYIMKIIEKITEFATVVPIDQGRFDPSQLLTNEIST